MRLIKNIVRVAIIIVGLISAQKEVQATHIAGSHIGYRVLDSTTYEITLTVYRDCNGIALVLPQIKVSGKPSGIYYSTTTHVSTTNITGAYLNCSFLNKCSNSSSLYGIEKLVYKDTVDVSGGACEYMFSYNGTSRIATITTGAANLGYYNYAIVNKCLGLNNSVQADIDPQMLLSLNQNCYLNSFLGDTIDKMDSVGYELVEIYSDSGIIINYSGSWSPQKPISFLGFPNPSFGFPAGFHFDKQNNNLKFRPQINNQVSPICIEAKEYREVNGIKEVVGFTRLEYVLIVANSANKTPFIKAESIIACTDQESCIEIETQDLDTSDSTYLIFKGVPKGATVTYGRSGRFATAKVCWTPTASEIRNNPYNFIAIVNDDACQIGGRSSMALSFTVKKTPDSTNLKLLSKIVQCNSAEIIVDFKDTLNATGLTLEIIDEDSISSSTNDTARIFFKGTGWKKFHVTAKASSGCSYTITDSVFINPSYSLQLSVKNDTAICEGDTVELFTFPTNGVAPYMYSWRNLDKSPQPFEFAKTNITKQRVLEKSNYYALVVDSNYCVGFTDTATISTNKLPIVDVGQTQTVCPNMPFTLTATPYPGVQVAHYNWLGIDTLPSVVSQTDTARHYTVTTISPEGCTYTRSIFRYVHSIGVDAGSYSTICGKDSLLLIAKDTAGTVPFKFIWINTNDTTNTLNITPLKDTAYIVKMIDTHGCEAFDTAEIKVFSPPSFTVPPDTALCSGDSVTLIIKNIIATPPYQLTWNDTLIGDSIIHTSSTSTKYIIELIDSNGCQIKDSMQVTVNTLPTFAAPANTAICSGDSIVLTAKNIIATTPYQLTWNNTHIGDSIIHASSTSTKYVIELVDSNGCRTKDSMQLTVNTLPSFTAPSDTSICKGLPITLTAKNIVATQPYQLSWNTLATGDSISITALLSAKYILELKDSNNCHVRDSMQLTVYDVPTVSINTKNVVCNGTPILIEASTLGGTQPFSFTWSNGKTTDTFTRVINNPENFSVKVTDVNGCEGIDSTTISLHTLLKIDAGTYPPICINDSVQLKASVLSGTPPYSYTWMPNNIVTDTFTVSPSVTTSYSLTVKDTSGCVSYDTAEIVVNSLPSFSPPPTTEICDGDNTTLFVTNKIGVSPFNFTWDKVLASDSFSTSLSQTETIIIEMSDANNCKSEDSVLVIVNKLPKIQLDSNKTVCEGSVQFIQASITNGKKPYKYRWSNNDTTAAFSTAINTPVVFTLGVIDSNGCKAIDSIKYSLFPKDSVFINPVSPKCETASPVTLVASLNTGIWSGNGVTNDSVFNPQLAGKGLHKLDYNYTSSNNCKEAKELFIVVKRPPIVDFVVDKTKGVPKETFIFTNMSNADTTYRLKWDFGDTGAVGNISTLTNPNYAYNKKGVYTVKLTVNDSVCPPVTETKLNYILVDSAILSVMHTKGYYLKLYPNPAKDKLTVEIAEEIASLTLTDALGKVIKVNSTINSTKAEIIVGVLPSGIYLIEAKDITGKSYTGKVQVSR